MSLLTIFQQRCAHQRKSETLESPCRKFCIFFIKLTEACHSAPIVSLYNFKSSRSNEVWIFIVHFNCWGFVMRTLENNVFKNWISLYCLLGYGTKCLSSFASFGSPTNFRLTFIAVGTGFMDCEEKLLENRQVMAINPSNRRLRKSHRNGKHKLLHYNPKRLAVAREIS